MNSWTPNYLLIPSLLLVLLSEVHSQKPDFSDLVYASVDGINLQLDLYLPTQKPCSPPPPLVVWIHGGAWRSGSKSNPPIQYLLEQDFAIASVDYRLSTQAPFPALIHDCKSAIRWLRANEDKYRYSASKIAIAGSSAGGHMVALLGVTNNSDFHEGNIGNLEQSSSVQAVINYYGPTNFLTILHQSTPHGLSVRVPALQLLLGSQPEENPSLARLASPVNHVDKGDPPLLILHGDQDPQVPINQSHELHHQYTLKDLPVEFQVVHGGKHGGTLFHSVENQKLIINFLNKHIR